MVAPFSARAGISLDPATGVVSRIFSPNGDGINDLVFFKVENSSLEEVTGSIFDLSGGKVADLTLVLNGIPTPDSFSWDGRDSGGSPVPTGVYLYEFVGGGTRIEGAVVVAR